MRYESKYFHTFDGMDATGKSTILDMLHKQIDARILRSPPTWMKKYRELFEKTGVESRYIFYAFGNYWLDRVILRPQLEQNNPNKLFLQDRSWIATLAAHELRGISQSWLDIGTRLAASSVAPKNAFLIYVDPEVRHQRLFSRNLITSSDRRNLLTDEIMNKKYQYWAAQLNWNINVFDNTHFNPEEACVEITKLIKH